MSTKGSMNINMKNERLMKFVNYTMKCGKRSLALKILSNTFEDIAKKGHENAEEVFSKAIENVMPKIEVRPKRVG